MIRPLTTLRAFLAFWVLLRHWFYNYPGYGALISVEAGYFERFFEKGYLGVDGFFILSGFILALNYPPEKIRGHMYRHFLINRLARIYPVHLVCLFLILLTVLAKQMLFHKHLLGTDQYNFSGLFANIFLVNAWRLWGDNGWNDVAWSVSAEWFGYILFPLFVILSRSDKITGIFLKIAVCICLIVFVESLSADKLSLAGGLVRFVPEFYLGVLAYRLRERVNVFTSCSAGAALAVLGVIFGIVLNIDTIIVGSLGVFIFSLSYGESIFTKPLSWSWLVYLGEISYSLYMVQRVPQGIFSVLRDRFAGSVLNSNAAQTLFLLSLTIVSASVLYHVVEVPARKYIRRKIAGGI